MTNKYLLILLIAFLLTGCQQVSSISESAPTTIPEIAKCIPEGQVPQTAKVVEISDGDTITVEISNQQYRLRYIGINTPELGSSEHALAEKAANYNRSLVDGQEVTLYIDTSHTDRFDRLLRYVIFDQVFINYQLVRSGMARARDYYPDSACKEVFLYAEKQARKEELGIWMDE